jgi:hypothetical protein
MSAIHENATNAFVETSKVRKEILDEVRSIVKTKLNLDSKIKNISKYLNEKGIKHKYTGNILHVNSGGNYSTIYEFKL